ncbi:unnamed protein product [Diatraea saccharalis]|uniref:Neurotransmitter-gated ion-channel transmembrane domain-containing protein n=1 Tax=Diatraea saccharalis TaxID=40085 RepID=A0A9N9R7I5_9NEOP|nr:unnamed protein product [Diatraea saccharalis]
MLTSLKSRDDAIAQGTPSILATTKNLSHSNDDYWDDSSEEFLLSNYNNDTFAALDTEVWKKNIKRSINDAVSKNITSVLENLLKNYENSQLPTHGKDAYSNQQLVYQWQNSQSVNFVPGMTLSQFDLISFPYRNFTFTRREGDFSVLQVSFNLQRHTGYFLIQVYVPCILIVVLSWVSFWIHREATSDRVGLGITTVLTLSTISLDSRTDLPKVRYATALDWFLLMSFFYCIATLLEFAGVHYFTKVGSGEIVIDDSEWEELIEEVGGDAFAARQLASFSLPVNSNTNEEDDLQTGTGTEESGGAVRLTMERTTQTERRVPRWRQLLYCLAGDDKYRRQRQVEAGSRGHINSVSHIDRAARVLFPASFALLNLFYWLIYAFANDDFAWSDNPMNSLSH